jgi:hypothetical protein
VYELEGQDMDEDEEAAMSDGDGSATEPGLALKPHGWSEGRDNEVIS